jgi:hypothetical protein
VSQLVVASFESALLVLVLSPVRQPSLEAAFTSRVRGVEGRSLDRGVARIWGRGDSDNGPGDIREELAVFGSQGAAWGRGSGSLDMLRAACLFAQGRLRRSRPALHVDPLDAAATAIGEAPLRAFAPGPFRGTAASALGGLLQATTAIGVAVRPAGDHGLMLSASLMGAWGADGPAAAERMTAAFGALAADPLGRILGTDRPIVEPATSSRDGELSFQVTLNAPVLANGLHAVTDATVTEIMAY